MGPESSKFHPQNRIACSSASLAKLVQDCLEIALENALAISVAPKTYSPGLRIHPWSAK